MEEADGEGHVRQVAKLLGEMARRGVPLQGSDEEITATDEGK